jgi:4-hydroxy-2-oxoheptanedioate aldolase
MHAANRDPSLRERLRNGGTALGTFVFSVDPTMTQAAGAAGMDFVIVDTEHTATTMREVLGHVRAAPRGLSVLVRVAEGEVAQAARALDQGAAGIVIPHVRSVEQLRGFVAGLRYHPDGARGECSITPATDVGIAGLGLERRQRANAEVLVVGLFEDIEAVDAADDLVASGLLDVVMPGPRDLGAAFERAGADNPADRVAEATDRIGAAVEAHASGVAVGRYVPRSASISAAGDTPARFLVYRIDVDIVAEEYVEAVRLFREGTQ